MEVAPPLLNTNLATGLTQAEANTRLEQYGYNEVADKKTYPVLKFLSKFWGLTPCMLEFIIVLSWFLHKRPDAYIVSGLLFFNSIIGFAEEENAARAVEALKKKLQINVKLLRDSVWKTVVARELVPGDIIRIRVGDFVPADIHIIEGDISIDQSSLTGESAEIEKKQTEAVYSGSVVRKGEATGMVTLTGSKTYFGKTVQLVKTAKPKSHIDDIISMVVKWLLAIVVTLLSITLIVCLLHGINLLEILPLLLVLLLGAIPVALASMFTVSMALGSKELVKQGVLVTRLNAPEDAASMDVLCVDKTGTLTINKLTVAKLLPSATYTENDLLLYGALASQEANHDALDMALISAARERNILSAAFIQKSFIPFDPQNRKTEAAIKNGDEEFTVMKGAFDVIAALCSLSEKDKTAWANQIDALASSGYRAIAVAQKKNKAPADFAGLVALHDPPRPDSLKIIGELQNLGIAIKMLTGDALPIAQQMSKSLNIGDKILNAAAFNDALKINPAKATELLEQNSGFAGVYPEDKYNIVKTLQDASHIVGMTGDGVNDSPALKQAEVGIAVSNASDVAKAAASIILTEEGLSNIPTPIKIGRKIFQRINIWILNKFAQTILKTCLVVFAFLILGKFVITASAMLLMVFMTDFVIISLSTDNVQGPEKPAKWDIRALAKTGMMLGLMLSVEAFGLLYIGVHYFHINADNAALNTFSFDLLLYFALFTIFVVREKRHFWSSMPGTTLLLLLIGDMVLGLLFSVFGCLGLKAIPLAEVMTVIGYSLICAFVINDWLKYFLLKRKAG
jgi:H+-transporting ATPase